jgi:hypothetical protein
MNSTEESSFPSCLLRLDLFQLITCQNRHAPAPRIEGITAQDRSQSLIRRQINAGTTGNFLARQADLPDRADCNVQR